MAIKSFGGGGGGGAAGDAYMQGHDETLGGGASLHYHLGDSSVVERITGGSPYDLTGNLVWVPAGPGAGVGHLDAKRSTNMYSGSIGDAIEWSTALTCAAWIYRTAATGANLDIISSRIAGAGLNNNTLWALGCRVTTEKVGWWWQNGSSDNVNEAVSATSSTLDTWEHWTCTRPTACTSGKVYLNGVLDNTTSSLIAADGGTNTTSVVVGSNKAGTEFVGNIFSAIVFEEEMDDAGVLALYNSTSSTGSWE
jgi:hypothetical protein